MGGILSNATLPGAAANAERHQEAAGLASRLSAAELQRFAVLLRLRSAHAASVQLRETQPARAAELVRSALASVERMITLEGGRPTPPFHLRWCGFIRYQLGLLAPAAADFEAALAACATQPGKKLSWRGIGSQLLPCSPAPLASVGQEWVCLHLC